MYRLLSPRRGNGPRIGWTTVGDTLHGSLHRTDAHAGIGETERGWDLGGGPPASLVLPGSRCQSGPPALSTTGDFAQWLLHPPPVGTQELPEADVWPGC